jgi:DNA-binding CsgD family transcriptional regulator
MDNISIISDNVYTEVAFIKMTEKILTERVDCRKISIFIFEKTWLHEHELAAIIECKADRILIIALTPLLSFLSTLVLPRRIIYENYDASVSHVNITLRKLIMTSSMIEVKSELPPSEPRILTPNERNIILMFSHGWSLTRIAKMTNKSFKTISSHKRKAMKKMGMKTNIQLIQKGKDILMANEMNIISQHWTESICN